MVESPGLRGVVDAKRSADRLQYLGKKRVVEFVRVFTDISSCESVVAEMGLMFRFIIRNEWSAEEEEQLLRAENSTHVDFLCFGVDEAMFNASRKA
ncbi:unnamed protein product [Closterium sp. NIES-65]|nr:unnamed protein product [Closterium sp. NIES-65]